MHIRKDHLVTILKGVLRNERCLRIEDYDRIADQLLKAARRYSLTNRKITISNDKLLRQSRKLAASLQSDASFFSTCLVQIRRKFKHRGINQVQPGESEWLQLKEVCSLATDFCNEFGLERREGYLTYCEIAMGKMKNYSLNKFKSLHKAICDDYEAINIIKKDKFPSMTERAHTIYCALISERIGYAQGYKDMPNKYQYFVLASQEAAELGIEIGVYMRAQFFYTDFTNQIPDPVQLVGIKARDKLQKYCFENSIKINKTQHRLDWAKIKKR